MRPRRTNPARGPTARRGGLLLMECLVYLGLVMLLIGLGMAALHMAFTQSRHLREGSDLILQALHAGEQWRSDLRAARAAPLLESTATNLALRWSTAEGTNIDYAFFGQTIWRKVTPQTEWQPVLRGAAMTRFLPVERAGALGWRWELELAQREKARGMKPMFTFQAVPGFGGGAPP